MPEEQLLMFDVPAKYSELWDEVDSSASYGTRVTMRNRSMLASGRNPATGLRLIDGEHTCPTCVHLVVRTRNRSWFKCAQHTLGTSRSLASDIRKSWPACELWRAASE